MEVLQHALPAQEEQLALRILHIVQRAMPVIRVMERERSARCAQMALSTPPLAQCAFLAEMAQLLSPTELAVSLLVNSMMAPDCTI